MNLRKILLKFFLPIVLVFLSLNLISLIPSIQKMYHPLFEKFTISVLTNSMEDVFFKPQIKEKTKEADYNKIVALFQSKQILLEIMERANRTGVEGTYKYNGFNIAIGETFIAPLIFFFSLLLFTPGNNRNKIIAFLVGTILIMGFAWLIVYCKGQFMVNKSGVRIYQYTQNDINFFRLIHFIISPVTMVTFVLFSWILVAFRKSDLKKIF